MKVQFNIICIISIYCCSCTSIKNSFNNAISSQLKGSQAIDTPIFKSLRYSDFSLSSLDLHVLFESEVKLLSFHLQPSSGSNLIRLSGIYRSLREPGAGNDSMYVNMDFPESYFDSLIYIQYKNDLILLGSTYRQAGSFRESSIPIFVSEIDSNVNTSKLKTYSVTCRDQLGHKYYISAVTDPIPLIVVIVLGVMSLYKYYACSNDFQKKIDLCAEAGGKPEWDFHLFGSCEFKGCKKP